MMYVPGRAALPDLIGEFPVTHIDDSHDRRRAFQVAAARPAPLESSIDYLSAFHTRGYVDMLWPRY